MADVPSALKEVLDKYVTLLNSGNAAGVPEYHTKDCKVWPPNARIVEGSASTQAFVERLYADGMATVQRTDWELLPLGPDFATEIGRWTFFDKDGELVATYKGLNLLKKVDGTWKLHRVLYNSN